MKAQFAFKTPSLRDIAQRAPYMHDGSLPTLESVMRHYIGGGVDRPSRFDKMRSVPLEEREVEEIVASMRSTGAARGSSCSASSPRPPSPPRTPWCDCMGSCAAGSTTSSP